MAQLLRCPQGHHWESSAPTPDADTPASCPVCGETVASTHDVTAMAADRPARAEESASEICEAPTLSPLSGSWPVLPAAGPPEVPGYQIVREIGRGGMGVVYKAQQIGLNRPVALKMLLPGTYCGPEELAQFRAEAEAAARLQHPHIIHIHDIGDVDGRPYFSMEYADGGHLAARLRGHPIPARAAARFIETLARAVQAAHDAGVIHRDLKPANVLLQRRPAGARVEDAHPEDPLARFEPKITDFGLAHRAGHDRDAALSAGGLVGTPSYMAPEQVGGKSRDIGAPIDVYALGAILYETLTGRPPFRAATPLDTVLQVLSEEPVPPSRLQPGVPRDLETICLKCLKKEPRKRYPTPLALAEDLHRFLTHRPILARPTPFWERAMKWARRRPAAAALSVVLTLVAAGGLSGGVARWLRVEQRVGQAEATAVQREADLYAALIPLARSDWQANRVDLARQRLERECPERWRNWEWHYLRRLCEPGLLNLPGGGRSVALGPEGTRLAAGGDDGVRVWDDHGQPRVRLSEAMGTALVFDPAGRFVIAAARPAPGAERPSEAGLLKAWDATTGSERFTLRGHTRPVHALAISRAGRRLVSAGEDGTIKVWDLIGRREQATLPGLHGTVESLALSGDGQRAAAVGADGVIHLWDAERGRVLATFAGESPGSERPAGPGEEEDASDLTPHIRWPHLAALNPDGSLLAYAHGGTIRLRDWKAGREVHALPTDGDHVGAVAFSPDGRRLAVSRADHAVGIWEVAMGRELFRLRGHEDAVIGLSFSSDGRRLASTGLDHTVRLWDATAGPEARALAGHRGPVRAVCFTTDGQVVSAGADGTVRRRSPDGEPESLVLRGPPGPVRGVAAGPDGQLAAGCADGTVRVWDAAGQEVLTLSGHTERVLGVAWSRDGRRLASAGHDGTARVWDASTGTCLRVFAGHGTAVHAVAFGNDGRVASGGADNMVRLWDPESGQEILSLAGHEDGVAALAFQPDGRRLASAGLDGQVILWDPAGGREIVRCAGHHDAVRAVTFSPLDGSRLATGDARGVIKLWDSTNGQELLTLLGRPVGVFGLAFSPDARWLASADADGVIRLRDAAPVAGHPWRDD